MKNKQVELPQAFSDTVYNIYLCAKRNLRQQELKFGSSQWEIANALDRIESRIRNAEKPTPSTIELSYDDAVYLYRAIAVYMEEINTTDLSELQKILEKEIELHT